MLQSAIPGAGLRGVTLLSKFILMVFLAKLVPPEDVGLYGLFLVTVTFALDVVGLDFYTYAQREMLSRARAEWWGVVRNQLSFYGVTYVIVLPVVLLIFLGGLLPWSLVGWFYLLLTLEYLSQECFRLLVAVQKPVAANLALFLRSGAWVYVVVAALWYRPNLRELSSVWLGWSIGSGMSILLAIYFLREVFRQQWRTTSQVDWPWIRRGLRVAVIFLSGTLIFRFMFSVDRYVLDFIAGREAVGVYTFFMSIANAMIAVVEAGVVLQYYPKMIQAFRRGDIETYRGHYKMLLFGIVVSITAYLGGIGIVISPVLKFVGREEYISQIGVLWCLLAAMSIYALGLVPHYELFARGGDKYILGSNLVAVAVLLMAFAVFAGSRSAMGVALAINAAMIGLSATKQVAVRWIFPL